ncbi:GNAT family N-acetyltransferase [Streptomyces sp. TS71-3]|uniref:GNAT family N-acetyltransferase n=1 Tax=Streptomyces sp. TS71-3 TaxID=2733862 RepID=UPI001B2BDF96|nr:GNAT family N-acetyltransferase [Streptomyces sp. TS71-3]GHJ38622.1 N-acetyltransferase [Streptomyces sp. TS71-3]
MTVIVRAVRPEHRVDVEAFVRVRQATLPYILFTPESIAYDVNHAHPEAHLTALIAEEEGEAVGVATVNVAHDSPEPGIGNANIYVHPERRGRGAGSALLRVAEDHLAAHGVRKVFSWVLDEPANHAFAERRGFQRRRPSRFLRLDLTGTLPPRAAVPDGVELRSGADFAADPRPVFALDAETIRDEPSDVDMEFTQYEQWLADTWRHPLTSPELTTVALVDGEPAAFTLGRTDGTRYGTMMTGTARRFRGRGLARLCKTDALHRARAAGCTDAYTGNDADNGPMLAVNASCGYRVSATEVRYVRELG